MKLTLSILATLPLLVSSMPQLFSPMSQAGLRNPSEVFDFAATGSDVITNSGSIVQNQNGAHSTNNAKGRVKDSANTLTEGIQNSTLFVTPEAPPPEIIIDNSPIVTERDILEFDEFFRGGIPEGRDFFNDGL